MTTVVSHKQSKTPEEKARLEEKYRLESSKEFTEIVKNLVKEFNALIILQQELNKVEKGSMLRFPDGKGGFIAVDGKFLKTQYAAFRKRLLELIKYYKQARKKCREKITVKDLSGIYIPVYAGPALQAFFKENPDGFGHVDPRESRNPDGSIVMNDNRMLMDLLDLAKRGYSTRNTITMLCFIYSRVNGLHAEDNGQYVSADQHLMRIFGGDIPAVWYSGRKPGSKRSVKMLMSEAREKGLIEKDLNTFDLISVFRPYIDPETQEISVSEKSGNINGFRSERFNGYFFQNAASVNYFTSNDLIDLNMTEEYNNINSDEYREKMIQEHNLVKITADAWIEKRKPELKAKALERKIKKNQKADDVE